MRYRQVDMKHNSLDMKLDFSDTKLGFSDMKSGYSDMKLVLFDIKSFNFMRQVTYLSACVILRDITVVDSECSNSHLFVLGFHAGG